MTVTDGMDVERVRSIAQQLLSQSTKIDDVRSSGEGQIGVLEGAWSGPDLEKFEDGWDSAMPQLDHAGQALRSRADLRLRVGQRPPSGAELGIGEPDESPGR